MSVRVRRDRTKALIERRMSEEDKPLARTVYEQCILLEAAEVPLYFALVLAVVAVLCVAALVRPGVLGGWALIVYRMGTILVGLQAARAAVRVANRHFVEPVSCSHIHAIRRYLSHVPREQAGRTLAFLVEHDSFVARRSQELMPPEWSEESSAR